MSDVILNDAPAVEAVATIQETTPITQVQQPVGGWYESIKDENLRGYAENKKLSSIDDLVALHQANEKILGDKQNAILKPGENATPEEITEFYKALGRPEKADDYKLGDTDFSKSISEAMLNAGLTTAQAQQLSEHYGKYAETLQAAQQQQRQVEQQNQLESLQKEWSQNYDKNVELARRASRALGIDNDMAEKIQGALGVKGMMDLFYKIGSGFTEDTFRPSGASSVGTFGMSVEAARAKVQEYKSNAVMRQAYISGDPKARQELESANRVIAGAM